MSLSDQEQVILKAIAHAGCGGVALISDVVKAVSYPKAITKKVLIGLGEKGIVTLYRHDYPSSLAPADRKLMIRSKGNYYNAVTVRKKNPKGKHLPGLPAKAQREYEKILKSAKASGRYKGREKEVAARTVRKQYGPNPHGMSEKAWKAEENKWRKSIAAYRAKGWTFQQIKDRLWLAYGLTLDKLESEKATFVHLFGRGGFTLDLVPPLERRRMASKAKKQNPKRKKNKTIIKAKRVVVLNPKRKTAKKAVKRKRNLDHKDSRHQVEVSRHWRAGGLSQWQRAHKAGQHDLFAHGIKARNPKGPIPTPQNQSQYKALYEEYSHWRHHAKSTAEKALLKKIKSAMARYEKGLKHAPVSRNSKRAKTARAGASRAGRKAAKTRSRKSVVKTRNAAPKRATRNPSPESIRKEFAGAVSGSRDLYFPKGTPQGLAKLGKLVSITTEEGTIKPVSGSAWLCADTKEKLHIGSTSNAPLFDGPARSFGKVSKVEYESSKPHLGYKGPIIWFHHMGEESGHKPTLHADGKGGLVFRGGQYRLTKRGIEN